MTRILSPFSAANGSGNDGSYRRRRRDTERQRLARRLQTNMREITDVRNEIAALHQRLTVLLMEQKGLLDALHDDGEGKCPR